MSPDPKPECPQCGSSSVYETELPGEWRCRRCDAYFEPDGEGGNYSDFDPGWRLDREERRQEIERRMGRRRG